MYVRHPAAVTVKGVASGQAVTVKGVASGQAGSAYI